MIYDSGIATANSNNDFNHNANDDYINGNDNPQNVKNAKKQSCLTDSEIFNLSPLVLRCLDGTAPFREKTLFEEYVTKQRGTLLIKMKGMKTRNENKKKLHDNDQNSNDDDNNNNNNNNVNINDDQNNNITDKRREKNGHLNDRRSASNKSIIRVPVRSPTCTPSTLTSIGNKEYLTESSSEEDSSGDDLSVSKRNKSYINDKISVRNRLKNISDDKRINSTVVNNIRVINFMSVNNSDGTTSGNNNNNDDNNNNNDNNNNKKNNDNNSNNNIKKDIDARLAAVLENIISKVLLKQ